ncbi:chemotaxis protein CheB [Neokomagataea thailandica]|uniref:Protein-glutamate methylesterase/protein-glutamine glutaminase n=1 Tax=Neokomagataea tanensis NBRC 106556 TaxID=1223519 RepID=A0ABQ0QJJ3_9PROT|nr:MULTISPECIES: chemotaxis protein CheB [Neokomagataea]GBR47100.1 chemotaxis protein CheB [Neokomagataea tanensis NBRC 106556]
MTLEKKIKVLIIDDSITARALISFTLKKDKRLQVVGAAGTPYEARDMIISTSPDIITLDIEMPGMNGLQFLKKIMNFRPMPVVIVSSFDSNNKIAEAAYSLGATSFFSKKEGGKVFSGLAEDIVLSYQRYQMKYKVIAIGSSTGGISALEDVLKNISVNSPPIVVVQHILQNFAEGMVKRLNVIMGLKVVLAEEGMPLENGVVFVAPGQGRHLKIIMKNGRAVCHLCSGEKVSGHRPSINVLFNSISTIYRNNAIGVILTGMGDDGAHGLLAMKNEGALTIVQDENTSVVYGMPKKAFECGAVCKQLPLGEIGKEIQKCLI